MANKKKIKRKNRVCSAKKWLNNFFSRFFCSYHSNKELWRCVSVRPAMSRRLLIFYICVDWSAPATDKDKRLLFSGWLHRIATIAVIRMDDKNAILEEVSMVWSKCGFFETVLFVFSICTNLIQPPRDY